MKETKGCELLLCLCVFWGGKQETLLVLGCLVSLQALPELLFLHLPVCKLCLWISKLLCDEKRLQTKPVIWGSSYIVINKTVYFSWILKKLQAPGMYSVSKNHFIFSAKSLMRRSILLSYSTKVMLGTWREYINVIYYLSTFYSEWKG